MTAATEELKQVPLFNGLNQRQLSRLAAKTKERKFKAGTAVVHQGKMSGIGFFIVTDGLATVNVGEDEVATVGPGDHFGELAPARAAAGVRSAQAPGQSRSRSAPPRRGCSSRCGCASRR